MKIFRSSCHCGSVQCTFKLPTTAVVQCHCNNCRKLQGSDYSSWVAVNTEQFSIDEGQQYLTEYRTNEGSSKNFCALCGSAIYCINNKHFAKHKLLPLGSVDNYSVALKPLMQVYTQDKAQWLQLHDDIPLATGQ